ncbi:unnamed protein product [Linum tenue]|uniref:F-box domain-containing protein n=1 Tax=Linum tenue TaxID=586396 RepID=A0AAV0QNQ1_9ROSI|nr:unnamed protein product [Linum tenue]
MNKDGRSGKRHRDEQEEEVENRSAGSSTTDRLTHLPKHILYHILSFIDTKSSVQTCVLSLDWNRAWKHVPVLNFDRTSFHPAAKFDKLVSKVLSLRYDLKLRKVVYLSNHGRGKASRALQVVGYALSHHVQELTLDSINNQCRDFSVIFSDYCDDNEKTRKRNDDLKTLNLSCFKLERGFAACSGFPPNADHLEPAKMRFGFYGSRSFRQQLSLLAKFAHGSLLSERGSRK